MSLELCPTLSWTPKNFLVSSTNQSPTMRMVLLWPARDVQLFSSSAGRLDGLAWSSIDRKVRTRPALLDARCTLLH